MQDASQNVEQYANDNLGLSLDMFVTICVRKVESSTDTVSSHLLSCKKERAGEQMCSCLYGIRREL